MTCIICERYCGRICGVRKKHQLIERVCRECKIIMDLHSSPNIMYGRLI